MKAEDLRAMQAPFKALYREVPEKATITLKAKGALGGDPGPPQGLGGRNRLGDGERGAFVREFDVPEDHRVAPSDQPAMRARMSAVWVPSQ
jgi:hypothetical protein